VAAAAVMRASHRAARVTAAPAAALRSLSREVRVTVTGSTSIFVMCSPEDFSSRLKS